MNFEIDLGILSHVLSKGIDVFTLVVDPIDENNIFGRILLNENWVILVVIVGRAGWETFCNTFLSNY